ncbi:ferredoxin [Bacteroidia bacterium]|nr:ferredoxin [Bacteroidia bacterium]
MDSTLLFTILTLCAIGVVSAVVLYVVAQRFKVDEDERIDTVESMLPGANCGGCGYAGCRSLAEALVGYDDIANLYCPVGGAGAMKAIADYLGKTPPEKEPQVAVVRCNGVWDNRPRTNRYDGAQTCAVIATLYGGETGCIYGCLGRGDCQAVCQFGAIRINPVSMLPEVDQDRCTACGACAKACPKMLIELRRKGPKDRRIYVACRNRDKGAISRKNCNVSCIACGKCRKACQFEAITVEGNLARIDPQKCRLCRKCVPECPTGAIREVNFTAKANGQSADQHSI